MDLFKALTYRRSIRKYTNTKVSNEQLNKIIEYGMFAPSAVNKQPWHFIIFRNSDSINKLVDVHPKSSMLKSASAGILICFDDILQYDKGYGPIDCSAATQNMLLAAHGMGLGACWIGIYPKNDRVDVLSKAFNLPEHVVPFAVISIGYPAEELAKPSRFKTERIHFEKWNTKNKSL
jgi:nitroreductase